MRFKKQVLPLAFLSLAAFATTASSSGFGSKSRDNAEQRSQVENSNATARGRGSRPALPQSTPFDFGSIAADVNTQHSSVIQEELGGHVEQADLEALPAGEDFIEGFELGDELFEFNYNAIDGVGANVGNGKRFSSMPRPDLDGGNSWENITPVRTTGPNADSCLGCHNSPVADGAGGVNDNTVRIDTDRSKNGFIERQTPHIFGAGGVQLLAEEMTVELQSLRDAAIEQTCESRKSVRVNMTAKGVDFGSIVVLCNRLNFRNLNGVDRDLVVKPFEWKGLTGFVRDFVRGASHQELGMQAVELVGDADSDFDGVTGEFTVGDVTALALYVAGQQRPASTLELNQITSQLTEEELETYGLPLSNDDIASISAGETLFEDMQCAGCHVPSMTVDAPTFSEPSKNADYRDEVFPAGTSVALPQRAIEFDITSDIFVNEFALPSGQTLGNFEQGADGGAVVRLYGDLKRHYMGEALAEDIDEGNVGEATFLTENLWGVGNTPPYLHDGRATTLTEAILYHGGDAEESKAQFVAASDEDKASVISFLDSLVIFIEGE